MNSQNISEIILNSNYYTKNIIELLYRTGLTISQIVKLKIEDLERLNSLEYSIKIVNSKFILPASLVNRILANNPKEYLFETRNGKPIHKFTISKLIIKEGRMQGIKLNQRIIRYNYIYNKLSKGINPELLCKKIGINSVCYIKKRFKEAIDKSYSLNILDLY